MQPFLRWVGVEGVGAHLYAVVFQAHRAVVVEEEENKVVIVAVSRRPSISCPNYAFLFPLLVFVQDGTIKRRVQINIVGFAKAFPFHVQVGVHLHRHEACLGISFFFIKKINCPICHFFETQTIGPFVVSQIVVANNISFQLHSANVVFCHCHTILSSHRMSCRVVDILCSHKYVITPSRNHFGITIKG